jgi:hypothetical protein
MMALPLKAIAPSMASTTPTACEERAAELKL